MPRIRLIIGDDRRRRTNGDAQERQRPDPDERSTLRERERFRECITKGVPGEPAEQMTAQPFSGGQSCGKREDTFGPAHPDQPGDGQAQCGVKREIGR